MKLRYDDQYHSYWLDGDRCSGVTTIAKIPDDTYLMEQAGLRKLAIGLALTPPLLEAVAANIDDRKKLKNIIYEAQREGGAHEGRDRGITAHTITERHDLGKQVVETPLAVEILGGWQELVAAAGFTILPEFVERMILYPEDRIAGRLDRIVRLPDGRLAVLDVKGGKWAVKFPHPIAIQLALYAHAPLMAKTLVPISEQVVEATEFEPMPDVDQEWGVIAHFPEDGPAQLVDVNIALGWKAAQKLCFPTMKWRALGNLTRPHRLLPVGLRAVVERAPEPPAWEPPPEGELVDDDTVASLRDAFRACPHRAQVNVWLEESVAVGRSFNIAGPHNMASVRRFEIIRAAIAWSMQPEDVVRAALGFVMGDEVQPAVTVGCALGSLTQTEAVTLTGLADLLDAGTVVLTFSDDGSPRIGEPQPTAAA